MVTIVSKSSQLRESSDRGKLDTPIGVAVDTNGTVYVSECGDDRIFVFTSEGQFATSFGRWEEKAVNFKGPCEVSVDYSGVVYVCDGRNNQIQLL